MMKPLLKLEMTRAFYNKFFLFASLIGLILVVLQFVQVVLPLAAYLDYYRLYEPEGTYPLSVFNRWIGGESYSPYASIYTMLMPILTVLPFADSYFTDRKNGMVKNILLRTKKKNYFISKYIAVFLSGGVVFTLPLLINFMLSAATLPSLLPEASTASFPIFETSMWSGLYYSQPYLYFLFYFLIDFVFAGLFPTIALAITHFVENRFVVLLSPFLLNLFLTALLNFINASKYSPNSFLNMSQPYMGIQFSYIVIEMLILFLVTASLFLGIGIREEVY